MKDEYVSKEAVLKYIRKAAETAYGDCKDAIGDAFNYLADDLEMYIIRPSIVKPPEGEYISKKEAVDALCFDYAYAAADIVNKMPGIDAAPVVHGRWVAQCVVETDDGWTLEDVPYNEHQHSNPICSICRKTALLDGGEDYVTSLYCPNCGANMDEQEG